VLVIKQFIRRNIFFGAGLIFFTPMLLNDSASRSVSEVYSSAATTTEMVEIEDDVKVVRFKNVVEETSEISEVEEIAIVKKMERLFNDKEVPVVPFYSQFTDITASSWKKIGCGIASLAMVIEYYKPGTVVVDTLLDEAIDANAYLDSAGWIHSGLIDVSSKYNLHGEAYDYGSLSMDDAYEKLNTALKGGPVMASVHYTFQKTNPIPHLVIVNGVEDGEVFYNDPAEERGGGAISVAQFQSAWKKRYIEFRPI